MIFRFLVVGIGAVQVLSMAGCTLGTSSPFDLYDPAKAAEVAIEMYDADQDGLLDEAELEKCPALQGALVRVDTNRDRAISSEEIAGRLEAYKSQSRLVATSVLVRSGPNPVPGVSVTLELEPFMGGGLLCYSGTTDERGTMEGVAEESDMPPGLLPPGFYRVCLSPSGDGVGEVVRGCEVADDAPHGKQLAFSLDSKNLSDRGKSGPNSRRQ